MQYEAQKIVNMFKGNRYTVKSSSDAGNLRHQKIKNPTATNQGEQEGVSDFTVKANEKFAQGIDAIREVSPELADSDPHGAFLLYLLDTASMLPYLVG
jgi:hypothetical protein